MRSIQSNRGITSPRGITSSRRPTSVGSIHSTHRRGISTSGSRYVTRGNVHDRSYAHNSGRTVIVNPRHNSVVTTYPSRNVSVYHRHHSPVVHRRYYYPTRRHVVIARPSYGTCVDVLPHGYVSLRFGSRHYYRCDDVYYNRVIVDNRPRYVVVQPPVEALIQTLPADYQIIEYAGQTYYVDIYEEKAYIAVEIDGQVYYQETDLDVDVDFEDGGIEIEIDD